MSPSRAVSSATEQAEQLKKDGNNCFKKDRFAAAIDAYTEAITLCPNVPVYWTNRALCHRRRNDWERVEEDCRKALQLDNSSVKGHYMLGLALMERQEYAEGVKKLEKALDLGRGEDPKSYMVEEIWQELAKARYMEWEHASSSRAWELQKLKEALEQVFNKAAEADVPTEVPDYLCCRITLDIFRDPVITPSGVTYERAVIIDHLQQVGMFDPTTREPLDEYQLVSNLAIKEAVQAFLKKHGWAYKTE